MRSEKDMTGPYKAGQDRLGKAHKRNIKARALRMKGQQQERKEKEKKKKEKKGKGKGSTRTLGKGHGRKKDYGGFVRTGKGQANKDHKRMAKEDYQRTGQCKGPGKDVPTRT